MGKGRETEEFAEVTWCMRTGDNIRLRADGRYEARYIKERTESGRAVYGSCYGKTYEEAKAKRDQILDQKVMEDFKPKGMNLLILGAGSHGQEVYEIASALHVFDRIELLDDDASKETLGTWQDAEKLTDRFTSAIVAVGNEKTRHLWSARLTEMGYVIPTLVHPTAVISQNAHIGTGSVVCARATVSSGASVGNGCIISASVTVGRDAVIPNWTHIAEGGIVVRHSSGN